MMTDCRTLDDLHNATVQTAVTYLLNGTSLEVKQSAIIAAFSTLDREERIFFAGFLARLFRDRSKVGEAAS